MDQPITATALAGWLEMLERAVLTRPDAVAVSGRIEALLLPCGQTLPLAVLNQQTQAAAIRAFTRWPSAGELAEFLEGHTATLRRRLGAFWLLSRPPPTAYVAPPLPQPRPEPSVEELASVATMVGDLVDHLRPEVEAPRKRIASPASDEMLLRTYTLQASSPIPGVAALARLRRNQLLAKASCLK